MGTLYGSVFAGCVYEVSLAYKLMENRDKHTD